MSQWAADSTQEVHHVTRGRGWHGRESRRRVNGPINRLTVRPGQAERVGQFDCWLVFF